MKILIYLLLILFTIGINAQTQDCVESECPSLFVYDCEQETCVHKGIFPLTFREIFGAILIVIFSGLLTSGGMGGGGIYTPILLMVFSYESSKAVMLVYCMIFGGSLGNFLNVAFQKDVETGKPLLLYDFALIVTPMMILGSTIGILLNKMTASILIIGGLLYFVQDMARKLYKRAWTTYEKESQAMSAPLLQEEAKSPAKDLELVDLKIGGDSPKETTTFAPELEKIIQEEREPIPKTKAIFLLSIISFIILVSLLRGTEKIDSFLGIEYCSGGYWLFYLLSPAGCYLFYLKGVQMVKQNIAIKHKYNYNDSSYDLKENEIQKITKLGLAGGLLSALIGGGGGMFLGPPMLAMGIGAQSMSATAGLFTTLTSLGNLVQAFLLGGFTFSEFAFFFLVSAGGAYMLSNGISQILKRYKRPSILLFIISSMLFFTMATLPLFTLYKTYENPGQMLKFHSLC